MKAKTLIVLYTIAAALGACVVVTKLLQSKQSNTTSKYLRGDLPMKDLHGVSEIEIQGADQHVTLTIEDAQWIVKERENYPANTDALRSTLRTLSELSVAQSLEAGPSFDPRFGMDESSSIPENHGLVVTMKRSDQSVVHRVKIGKETDSGKKAPQDPMAAMMGQSMNSAGRFIRLESDPANVYAVNAPLSELDPSPKNWLREDFLKAENIVNITLSNSNETDQIEWEATRNSPTEEFAITGETPEGTEPDAQALTPLKNLFSYARFEDVVSEKAATGLGDATKQRKAILKTESGLIYHLTITPKLAKESENYLVSITVENQFPKERTKKEDETEEEAKTSNETFEKKRGEIETLFTQMKQLEGRIFEVTEWTLGSLVKDRASFFKAPAPPQPANAAPAYTPPIQVGQ